MIVEIFKGKDIYLFFSFVVLISFVSFAFFYSKQKNVTAFDLLKAIFLGEFGALGIYMILQSFIATSHSYTFFLLALILISSMIKILQEENTLLNFLAGISVNVIVIFMLQGWEAGMINISSILSLVMGLITGLVAYLTNRGCSREDIVQMLGAVGWCSLSVMLFYQLFPKIVPFPIIG